MILKCGRSMKRPRSWALCWIFIRDSAGCRPERASTAIPCSSMMLPAIFPDLKINAFHMGYPYCDDLNMVAMGHPNVYVCLSLLVPWAITAPRKFAQILGEAMRLVGPDRIIWGTDYAGFGVQVQGAVKGLRNFQIPEDMQDRIWLSCRSPMKTEQRCSAAIWTASGYRYDKTKN